jgi:hypothetical protein
MDMTTNATSLTKGAERNALVVGSENVVSRFFTLERNMP